MTSGKTSKNDGICYPSTSSCWWWWVMGKLTLFWNILNCCSPYLLLWSPSLGQDGVLVFRCVYPSLNSWISIINPSTKDEWRESIPFLCRNYYSASLGILILLHRVNTLDISHYIIIYYNSSSAWVQHTVTRTRFFIIITVELLLLFSIALVHFNMWVVLFAQSWHDNMEKTAVITMHQFASFPTSHCTRDGHHRYSFINTHNFHCTFLVSGELSKVG